MSDDIEPTFSFAITAQQQELALRQARAKIAELEQRVKELEQDVTLKQKGLGAVASLINEPYGVSGLHLNGDIAPWSELQTGGRFEEWLHDFDAAIKQQSSTAIAPYGASGESHE